jgi:hypothetical protein
MLSVIILFNTDKCNIFRTLNVDKIFVVKFGTNSRSSINLNIGYDNETIFLMCLLSYFQVHGSLIGENLCYIFVWNDVFLISYLLVNMTAC